MTKRCFQVATALLAVSAAGGTALADEPTVIANKYRTWTQASVAYKVETQKSDGWQDTVGTPMFWFDCSDTNGWTISAAGKVTKIPNKGTATSRYLTAVKSEVRTSNYNKNFYYNTGLTGPVLAAADDEIRGPYLDFGDKGADASGNVKGFFFNPVAESEGCSETNKLVGIGTVIGMYKSHDGGGQILGGGDYNRFHYGTGNGVRIQDELIRWNTTTSIMYKGRIWTDLQPNMPETSVWSGDWQAIAAVGTSAGLTAHGVAIGALSSDASITSAGQAIAELMIFDRVLTDDEIALVIRHLHVKWLGRSALGWDGNGSLSYLAIADKASTPSAGVTNSFEVCEGESLTIGRVIGGRATSPVQLEKTGAGTLRLDEADAFGGEVTVRGGTLRLGGKHRIPTFEELPHGLDLRLDPSVAESIDETDGLVSQWRDLVTTTRTADMATDATKPKFVVDALGAGLNVVDFGDKITDDGRYMNFNGSFSIATVIAVVDSRVYKGGHLMSHGCQNGADYLYDVNWYNQDGCPLLQKQSGYINDHGSFAPTVGGAAWANGLPLDKDRENVDTPAFGIVARRMRMGSIWRLGSGNVSGGNYNGGFRAGEILGWRRALTDEEVRDVQAYLAKKWLRRTMPGYENTAEVPEVQTVRAGGADVSIDVPAGTTALVNRVVADGVVRKTGGGTLKVVSFDGTATGLVLAEGAVEAGEGPDVASNCEVAADPSMRLDASDPNSILLFAQGGTNFVKSWQDMTGRISAHRDFGDYNFNLGATHSPSLMPFLNQEADALCNGRPVVDFGPMSAKWDSKMMLVLTHNLMSVRSVYFVLGSQNGGGNPFGWNYANNGTLQNGIGSSGSTDFLRSDKPTASSPLFGKSAASVKNGELYVDGVKAATVASYVPNGGYELVELHTAGPCQMNALACAYAEFAHGGCRLGEVVVFERELSEREKVATRNYLLKKWRGVAEGDLAPLPAKPALAKPAFSPERLVADFGNPQGIDYTGNVIGIRAGMEIELKNLPDPLELNTEITLLTADAVIGREEWRTLVPVGDPLPTGFKIKLVESNGVLKAKFVGTGMLLLVR